MKNPFVSAKGLLAAGLIFGLLAVLLQKLGNPPNMGLCVACFGRDAAGALGWHRAAIGQYLRPEFSALALGALLAALVSGEFKPRGGSTPLVRFFLGAITAWGALVFLGCPWRAGLRLAGGDGSALFGLAGFAGGVALGAVFMKRDYSLGASRESSPGAGWLFPAFLGGLLLLRLFMPPAAGESQSGILFYSLEGPGSRYAPLAASLGLALIIGFIGQRSRFCLVGALSDLLLFKRGRRLWAGFGFLAAAFLGNSLFGQFKPGFENQPIAHTQHLWSFLAMLEVGLASALAGGCPGRQLFLAGEGDADAAVYLLGLLFGAAAAHNWGMASSGAGLGPHGAAATIGGLLFAILIGLLFRPRPQGSQPQGSQPQGAAA